MYWYLFRLHELPAVPVRKKAKILNRGALLSTPLVNLFSFRTLSYNVRSHVNGYCPLGGAVRERINSTPISGRWRIILNTALCSMRFCKGRCALTCDRAFTRSDRIGNAAAPTLISLGALSTYGGRLTIYYVVFRSRPSGYPRLQGSRNSKPFPKKAGLCSRQEL